MKNIVKVIIATAILSASVTYAGTDSGKGFNSKLIDDISVEKGGFNDRDLANGGFNDKGLAKEVKSGWKKY